MTLSADEVDHLLAAVEARELRSLQWGYVDGSYSQAEILALLTETGHFTADAAESALETLLDFQLLHEFYDGASGESRYRSRFAEIARLLRTLKQLMPNRPWYAAPNLVSDFRIDARPRQAPRRNISPAQAIAQLHLTDFKERAAAAILGDTQLSAFQLRAATEIMRSSTPERNRGVVISAGTGSGKTLAFYLPALIEIASWVNGEDAWTKSLSIYPRIELLKDQFTEAFKLARRLDTLLQASGRRPITLGTLFSLTPRDATLESVEQAHWERQGNDDFICPFLRCPTCNGVMLWRRTDLVREWPIERLFCAQCQHEVTSREIVLTRNAARHAPPDMMFVTAEMVNQRLSDTNAHAMLGIHRQPTKRVKLLLLDEIHTFTDTNGAQTAMVIRRWRHAVESVVRCVGLSATLREAPDFFAQLTGLPYGTITEVLPQAEELNRLSMEYQYILRGDPVSQTSLLSTSIQAVFLLARVLERPAQNSPSQGRFGQRLFVFTDDLDIVNRLYDDLKSAEGYDIYGRHIIKPPLAALRSPEAQGTSVIENRLRDVQGQKWQLPVNLDRPLNSALRVSRTSSQDTGVSVTSDIVVATSSLEVGYNDLTVGAILQHKSPYEMASYLQRKGRAGRNLGMRPLFVTVLSDYGRDRLMFQAYEQLFDPSLTPLHLPIQNQYILRMHAVLSFIEWMTKKVKKPNSKTFWGWRLLNGPLPDPTSAVQQKQVRQLIEQLLAGDEAAITDLARHLERSLNISAETVQSLLWGAPRSLLLEVLPTLDRRLATNWQIGTDGAAEDLHALPPAFHPLPDFVAPNLFSDLCLPEVTIVVPPSQHNGEGHQESMPIVQALRQFAPGRVTRRFGYERGELSHWVSVPLDHTATYPLNIAHFASQYEYVADVQVAIEGAMVTMPCYRPWVLAIERTPLSVATTSNAFLDWSKAIQPHSSGFDFRFVGASEWETIVHDWTFYLHTLRAPVTVMRFAHRADATIRRVQSDEEMNVTTFFTTPDALPAAIGFAQEVDGLRVRFTLPASARLHERASKAAELPGWRVAYFRDLVTGDAVLTSVANRFQTNWLYQIYLSALVAAACKRNCSLPEAHQQLHATDVQGALHDVMGSIFQIDNDPDSQQRGKLQQTLSTLLDQEAIVARLNTLAKELWVPDQARWETWLQQRLHETLGEIMLQTCVYCVPQQTGIDTLLLDLGPLVIDAEGKIQAEIWITESTLGGVGVIESIARAISEENSRLSRALAAAMEPEALEIAALNLDRYMKLLNTDATIATATANVREKHDHQQRDVACSELYRLLSQRGLHVDHTFSTSLNYRLLRHDLNSNSDVLLDEILSYWHMTEARLGIALDLRVFAYLAISDPRLRPRIHALVAMNIGSEPTDAMKLGVIASLLWPRAAEVRTHTFNSYSPFWERGWTDVALVRELAMTARLANIHFATEDWRSRILVELATHYGVILIAPSQDYQVELRTFLAEIVATPISVGYLQFFPTLQRIQMQEEQIQITLTIQEVY